MRRRSIYRISYKRNRRDCFFSSSADASITSATRAAARILRMPRITFISRMTVKAGREQEFEQVCRALAETVAESMAELRLLDKELGYFCARVHVRNAEMNGAWT